MGVLTFRSFGVINRVDKPPVTFGAGPGDDTVVTLSSDNVDDRTFVVDTETTKVLWDATSSPVDALEFMWIDTDQEVVVELQTDANNGVGRELYTVTVIPGIPLALGSGQSYANYTVSFGGGTLDVIDKIQVRNLSTTDEAKVRIIVAG